MAEKSTRDVPPNLGDVGRSSHRAARTSTDAQSDAPAAPAPAPAGGRQPTVPCGKSDIAGFR